MGQCHHNSKSQTRERPNFNRPDSKWVRLGDRQQLRHVTYLSDRSLRAQEYITLRRSHGQITEFPRQATHITTEINMYL